MERKMTTEHTTRSDALMERARKYIPGGVNSPVRSWYNVGMTPRFIRSGKGPYLIDADGNEYIDYICSWGPMILGHGDETIREAVIAAAERGLSFGAPTETEVEIAQFISERIPSAEMLRMVNSGTEAVMSAIRLARGFTGRNKIIKFAGNYHGHSDCLLVEAGSGLLTAGIPGSAGGPEGGTADTLSAEYNNAESVEKLFDANPGQIAAVIVEPVAANMGVVLPGEGFLQKLRTLCTRNQALLIFDEVITGFRLAFGGAAEYFGITPDLVTYGKIIGGGMPVGAYGGRKDILSVVAPLGPVYQAGTLSGNPLAVAAGLKTLEILEREMPYTRMAELGSALAVGVSTLAAERGVPVTCQSFNGVFTPFCTDLPVQDLADAKACSTALYAKIFHGLLARGQYVAPSQFECNFVSAAHTARDVDRFLDAFAQTLSHL